MIAGTSSARTIRRTLPGSIFAAATGSRASSRANRRSDPAASASRSSSLADRGVLTGEHELVHHRPEIQTGPTDEERPRAAFGHVSHREPGQLLEPGHREAFRRLREVQEMVRHRGAIGR